MTHAISSGRAFIELTQTARTETGKKTTEGNKQKTEQNKKQKKKERKTGN